MKARLLTNSMLAGNASRDYLRLVYEGQKSSTPEIRLKCPAAHDLLDSFEEYCKPFVEQPVIPIKRLVSGLNESLQGVPSLLTDKDGNISGAGLFKGCKARLRGIPERLFIVCEIYWDYEEVRIKEIGGDTDGDIQYVVPWDCLEVIGK